MQPRRQPPPTPNSARDCHRLPLVRPPTQAKALHLVACSLADGSRQRQWFDYGLSRSTLPWARLALAATSVLAYLTSPNRGQLAFSPCSERRDRGRWYSEEETHERKVHDVWILGLAHTRTWLAGRDAGRGVERRAAIPRERTRRLLPDGGADKPGDQDRTRAIRGRHRPASRHHPRPGNLRP